jgi:beta-lactamase regulating signal transducer with metallopeptidase domain
MSEEPAGLMPVVVVEELAADLFVLRSEFLANPPVRRWTWLDKLSVVWAAVGLLACAWIGCGLWRIRSLLEHATKAPQWIVEELCRVVKPVGNPQPEVRISSQVSAAVAVGTFVPRIVLPEAVAVRSNGKAIRAALAHEWAHIRHGDLWLLALERFLLPVLALHPLFWLLRRSTRFDQEVLADAVAAGDEPVEYAEALLAWAKASPQPQLGLAALGMWEHRSTLSRRVKMILNRTDMKSRMGRIYGLAAVSVLLGLVISLSLITLRPLSAGDEPVAQQPSAPAIPAPEAAPSSTPDAAEPEPAVEPAQGAATDSEDLPSASKQPQAIMLSVTLMARDFDRVGYDKIKALVKLERIDFRMSGTERSTLKAELDSEQAKKAIVELQALEGVRTLCRSTIIALSGQQALIEIEEPGPRVEVETVEGTQRIRKLSQDISHRVVITPRTTADPKRVELTVYGGWLKVPVGVGNTLLLISTAEDEMMLISPTKVERSAAAVLVPRASVPIVPLVPDPQIAASPLEPARPIVPAPPTKAAPARVAVPQTAPPVAVPVVPGVGPVLAAAPAATPYIQFQNEQASVFTIYRLNENVVGIAERLRKRLSEEKIEGAEVTVDSRANSLIVKAKWGDRAAIQKLVAEMDTPPIQPTNTDRQTQKKLLELDLADAQLTVEEAEAQLDATKQLVAKGTTPQHELRKQQLQVERAKIQVKRIQIQLDAATESRDAPATPARTPRQR